jgi:hypothetical protein
MQEKWSELLESLEDSVDALTLEQIKQILDFFESGLSGYLAARLIKGDVCEDWNDWVAVLSK